MTESLLIVGASTRAAAFSALRAGLLPKCVDLFADLDLQRRCTAARLDGPYPEGFLRFLESGQSGSWMYAGGLENWPTVVERGARYRTLWGNDASSLSLSRDPAFFTQVLHSRNLPAPALFAKPPRNRRWLHKPRRGASGAGIYFGTAEEPSNRENYLQEFIEGESLALLFLGDGRTARFLGMTRQLVGTSWLHASPFHYCGSIGPLDTRAIRSPSLDELGHALAAECSLTGIFGIDGILRDDVFFSVEINPRYTASVEVLEYATGSTLLADHAHIYAYSRLPPSPPPSPSPRQRIVGKAILFAREDLIFPHEGPWRTELDVPKPVQAMPTFADIPSAGERIESGKPILTVFASANSPSACEEMLQQIAPELDRWLYRR